LSFKNIPQPVRTFAIAEAEGKGALPSPERQRIKSSRGFLMWGMVAAALLSITVGTTFWAYTEHERRAESFRQSQQAAEKTAAEQARREADAKRQAAETAQQQAELAAEKRDAEEARQRADAERQAAETARQKAQAEQQRAEEGRRRLAEAERKSAEAAQLAAAATPAPPRVAAVRPEAPRSPPAGPPTGGAVDSSGIYRGQICYGPGSADPARCYNAQAVVQHNQISGQWPGRDPGVTVYLAGHISPSGDVAIHMHGQRTDGSHFGVADLVGTLQEGRIDASGDFLNGRHVTLNWRRN
jgi:hypothetical protein